MINIDNIKESAVKVEIVHFDDFGLTRNLKVRTKEQNLFGSVLSGLMDIFYNDVSTNIHPDKYEGKLNEILQDIADINERIVNCYKNFNEVKHDIDKDVVETFIEASRLKEREQELEGLLNKEKKLEELEIPEMLELFQEAKYWLSDLESFYLEAVKNPYSIKNGEATKEFKMQNYRLRNIVKTLFDINERLSTIADNKEQR